MADYSEEIATALELIEEGGQRCEWRKGAVTPVDPDKPWRGGVRSDVVHHPFICFLPATDGSSSFGLRKFRTDSEDIVFTTFGLMGAQDFEPEVSDKVSRGGEPLVVKYIDSIRPAEQVVLYILSIA